MSERTTPESPGGLKVSVPTSPRYASIMESAVFAVVAGIMSRDPATSYLQAQAMIRWKTAEERRAFIDFGRQQLDTLTLEEAERCGLTHDQFAAWRRCYPSRRPVHRPG